MIHDGLIPVCQQLAWEEHACHRTRSIDSCWSDTWFCLLEWLSIPACDLPTSWHTDAVRFLCWNQRRVHMHLLKQALFIAIDYCWGHPIPEEESSRTQGLAASLCSDAECICAITWPKLVPTSWRSFDRKKLFVRWVVVASNPSNAQTARSTTKAHGPWIAISVLWKPFSALKSIGRR